MTGSAPCHLAPKRSGPRLRLGRSPAEGERACKRCAHGRAHTADPCSMHPPPDTGRRSSCRSRGAPQPWPCPPAPPWHACLGSRGCCWLEGQQGQGRLPREARSAVRSCSAVTGGDGPGWLHGCMVVRGGLHTKLGTGQGQAGGVLRRKRGRKGGPGPLPQQDPWCRRAPFGAAPRLCPGPLHLCPGGSQGWTVS